jgi:hypothetical protein
MPLNDAAPMGFGQQLKLVRSGAPTARKPELLMLAAGETPVSSKTAFRRAAD